MCILPQAEFPKLERPFARAAAACLLQARRLGCAPLPLSQAVPALHPGLEAALQGAPWDSRCAEQLMAHLDRAEAELDTTLHGPSWEDESAYEDLAEFTQPATELEAYLEATSQGISQFSRCVNGAAKCPSSEQEQRASFAWPKPEKRLTCSMS